MKPTENSIYVLKRYQNSIGYLHRHRVIELWSIMQMKWVD